MTPSRNNGSREARWPPIGRTPCVRCGHLYGHHARHAGSCIVDDCACKAFLHRALGDGTLVVTPEQLQDGYQRNPSIPLGGSVIQSERADYAVIARYDDGNYLVQAAQDDVQRLERPRAPGKGRGECRERPQVPPHQ